MGSIIWAVVWTVAGRSIITISILSPDVAWIPYRTVGVIVADVQTATVKHIT